MSIKSHALIPAVFVIFRRGESILLARRLGGWGSGLLCPPGGHVEPGESFFAAAIREVCEEVGIQLDVKKLIPYHIMHRKNTEGQERIDMYFVVENWQGEPVNKEPHKCSELLWVSQNHLPVDCVPIFKQGFELGMKGVMYSEDWLV